MGNLRQAVCPQLAKDLGYPGGLAAASCELRVLAQSVRSDRGRREARLMRHDALCCKCQKYSSREPERDNSVVLPRGDRRQEKWPALNYLLLLAACCQPVSQLRCPNEGRRTLRASRAPQQCAAFQGSSYIPRPGQAGAHTCSHLLTPAFLLQMAACQLLVVAASSLRQAESAIDTCSLTRLSMERGTSQASKST
jgi:hypothetical protein